jgi:hypothetical protein
LRALLDAGRAVVGRRTIFAAVEPAVSDAARLGAVLVKFVGAVGIEQALAGGRIVAVTT